MNNINFVAKKLNLSDIDCYGKYMAKINYDYEKSNNEDGKLILVTSINPTPYGEGKTTLSIGLNDSFNKLNKKSVAVLREPSLGPVFGRKGGAIGGGRARIEPSLDINLHFTGDFHAITSANNLLSSVIDNHIFQGNELNINKVVFKRCMDINDRELRHISLKNRDESFVITPASEIMAILCLSKNINDLKRRIGNILIGYTFDNKEIYAKDLKVVDALTILLKDAIKPNLVQTLYGNPVIVHGGPFANIAHGCNSLIATKTALKICDYTITEAGFGSDMGAIKFFDIKSRKGNIYPDAVVINCTIKALKYNGYDNLDSGLDNLKFHIENMKKFNDNIVVALNKFDNDKIDEINKVEELCKKYNVDFSICYMYQNGEDGCIDLAEKLVRICEKKTKHYCIYNDNDLIIDKIKKVCNLFGCKKVIINDEIKNKIENLQNSKFSKFPVCIAKTPVSISDDKNKLGYPKNFDMTVTDISCFSGAEFIVVYMGNILTMPGLGKTSNYLNMKIIDGKILGVD